MKFEKLNYSSGNVKKAFIIGFIICALIFIIINLFFTRAKYKLVESRKLASGTINYTLVDFELAGIKFKASGSEDYEDVDAIEDNYELNQDMSYCTEKYTNEDNSFEDVENNELTISFEKDTKKVSIKPYGKKGTKCYLYFDEKELNPSEKTLMQLSQSSLGQVDNFTGTSCNSGCTLSQNGIYEAEDDFGISYYYRGTVDNNWVVFGRDKSGTNYIWWRIIRINGNGTIRLMYAGTSNSTKVAPSPQGVDTMIMPSKNINSSYPRAVYFNQIGNDNTYVGYITGGTSQSTFENTHTNTKNSTILDEIVNWYKNNTNLSTLAEQYIDVDTGFCGDRQVDKTANASFQGDGYERQNTGYAPWGRLYNSGSWKETQTPTLKCGYNGSSIYTTAQERDLYTGPSANRNGTKGSNGAIVKGNNKLSVPVGLITMDEMIYAGGFGGQVNSGYWLYTNQNYWTMSPCYCSGFAYVFGVNNDGQLIVNNVGGNITGVRPVINLKADTKFEVGGAGSKTNPYVVVAT